MVRGALIASALALAAAPQLCRAETAPNTVTVPAGQAWTDTGMEVDAGVPLHITAGGTAWMVGMRMREWVTGVDADRRVGPLGTYVWPRGYAAWMRKAGRRFPLPAVDQGPASAFCLIGRIGEQGAPFYVGADFHRPAPATGRLWLGINDDELDDNHGHFDATITVGAPATALGTGGSEPPRVLTPIEEPAQPIPGARVLLLYVDGLRPDVLESMAGQGHLPNFRRAFLDRGARFPHAFTVFPSNTLIANGSLFTGLFSDRTGIKSQNQFERTSLKPTGQLSRWLPDGFMPQPETRVLNLLDKFAPEDTHAFLRKHDVATLASRLGTGYQGTTLPIMPINPPPQWFHRAINTIGPFNLLGRLPSRLDRVNAAYATEEMIGDPNVRVMVVWFPMVDKTSHGSARGQFGPARRDLAFADRYLGQILDRLAQVGWDRSTYMVLVSDHGHLGGAEATNRACNFPEEWAYQGLGVNAKVVGQEWVHPGIPDDRFIFFDNQGSGQAKLFLPYRSFFRGGWRRNRLHELMRYQIRPGDGPVDLIDSLTRFRPSGALPDDSGPVDLALVKLDDERVLIHRTTQNQAIISRRRDTRGTEWYGYEPVQRVTQDEEGTIRWDQAAPGTDPLGYLADETMQRAGHDAAWCSAAHSASEWLEATAHARYPDAVVTMAKFFAWHGSLVPLAPVRDPDLLLTASEGWSFRSDHQEGTDHGYPLFESMRITLYISGPNVRHGIVRAPQRIVNVLPTILEMVGVPYDPGSLDGHAIGDLYE